MVARATSHEPTVPWRDAWIGWRNKLIADPRFQRWAAASPLTRLIARRRARALFDLCAGFVYSQVLLACVRLRLCDHLFDGPRTVDSLARLMDLSPEAATKLLRAAASLRLVRALRDGRYALDDLGASMIGNPSVAAFIEHHELLYDDLRDPVALLRGETHSRLAEFWPYAADGPTRRSPPDKSSNQAGEPTASYAAYSDLMTRSQALVARDILDAYPLDRHRHLLDVGGGEGAFLAEVSARHPRLALTLFDLPQVADRARGSLGRKGLSARVELVGGSFLVDPLPTGADIISLVRILHDHDDESALVLLKAAFEALPSGGAILIAEPMAGTPGAEPIGDAYFGLYLLAMGRGRPRRIDELETLLETAGFSDPRAIPTRRPILTSAIVAQVCK